MTVRDLARRIVQAFLLFWLLFTVVPTLGLIETLHFVLTARGTQATEFAGYDRVQEGSSSPLDPDDPGDAEPAATLYPTFWYERASGERIRVRNADSHPWEWFEPGERVEILLPGRAGQAPRLADAFSLYAGDLFFLAVLLGVAWILRSGLRALRPRNERASEAVRDYSRGFSDPEPSPLATLSDRVLDQEIPSDVGRGLGTAFKVMGGIALVYVAAAAYVYWLQRGEQAMLAALDAGDRETVMTLARAGRGVGALGLDGRSVLVHALERRDLQLATALLEGGAGLGSQGMDEETPLSVAARTGDVDLVRLVLKHGANPRSESGPALVHAVEGRNMELVGVLLDAGVDVERGYRGGLTAGDTAVLLGHGEALRMIERAGGRFTVHPACIAVARDDLEALRAMAASGTDLRRVGCHDRGLAHLAGELGRKRIQGYLRSQGPR